MSGKDSNTLTYSFNPIGYCKSPLIYRNDAPRQAVNLPEGGEHYIELCPGRNFEQALEGLEGCERIWVVFVFHHNSSWKPKVQTPRGPTHKIGVFATRSPYRPNPIGLSCVRLERVEGRRIYLAESDLLDGTPILDLKPYIAYADAFPEAKYDWVNETQSELWSIEFSDCARAQIGFLKELGLDLEPPIQSHLQDSPTDKRRTRLAEPFGSSPYSFAYRTWRIGFRTDEAQRQVVIEEIASGYSETELADSDDRYGDKELHRRFKEMQNSQN